MRARSTLALCRDLTVNTHGLRTFFMRKHGSPSIAIAYSALIIDFKGVPMKLKIVALAMSKEKLIFTIFLTFYC